MNRNQFSPELVLLKREAIKLFKEGFNCSEIGKKLGVFRKTVSKWIKSEGFSFSKCNKAGIDSFIFSNIDTSEKAYWLGFLYADGHIKDDGRVELSLALKDKEHLEKFKKFLKFKGKIYESSVILKGKIYKRCRLHFKDTQITKDLITLGCVPNKTFKLEFPENLKFKEAFILGFFDGDGCISDPKKSLSINFIGTLSMIKGIINYIEKPIKIYRNKKHSEGIYQINICGNTARHFLKILYNNSPIFLDRKKQRFDNYIARFNRNVNSEQGKIGEG